MDYKTVIWGFLYYCITRIIFDVESIITIDLKRGRREKGKEESILCKNMNVMVFPDACFYV